MSILDRSEQPEYLYVENSDLPLSTSLKDCFCVSAKTANGKIPDCDCPNPQLEKPLCL